MTAGRCQTPAAPLTSTQPSAYQQHDAKQCERSADSHPDALAYSGSARRSQPRARGGARARASFTYFPFAPPRRRPRPNSPTKTLLGFLLKSGPSHLRPQHPPPRRWQRTRSRLALAVFNGMCRRALEPHVYHNKHFFTAFARGVFVFCRGGPRPPD